MSKQANNPKDPLASFIDRHREDFDLDSPSESVWNALDRSLPKEAQKPRITVIRQLLPFWKKAAVACMLLTIGLLTGMLISKDRATTITDNQEQIIEDPSNRVLALEKYYQREVDRRLSMVASYKPEPQLRQELSTMAQSDFRNGESFETITPDNERIVLEAIAQEYQAKLNALEKVLSQLESLEKEQPRINQSPSRTSQEL